jgi:HPt (histidine-containing phosphotransfer) domain-containing protein
MTLEELYELIGGNYEQALKIMRKDKLIDRYIRKLADSELRDAIVAASEQMDATQLYESGHALKGVYANLGLDALAGMACTITEEFRPGNPRTLSDDEVKAKVAELDAQHSRVLDGIKQYEEA